MNKRLMVICPSRQRPDKLKEMVKSFHKTAKGETWLYIRLDVDDPTFDKYMEELKFVEEDEKIFTDIGPRKSVTEIINEAFKGNPEEEYYSVTNDDFIYHTDGWDVTLRTPGVGFGRDGFPDRVFPVTSVINGNWVRAVNWLQLPSLERYYGDTVWGNLAIKLKQLTYYPDVFIEHKHWLIDEKNQDPFFDKQKFEETMIKDTFAYNQWVIYQSNYHFNKIVEAMCK